MTGKWRRPVTAMTGEFCFAVASLSALDYAYRSLLEKRPWPSGTPLPAAILIFLELFLLFRLWVLALVMGYPHIVRRYDFHKFIFGGSSCPTHRLRRNSPDDIALLMLCLPAALPGFLWTWFAARFCCSFLDDHVVNFLPRNTGIKLPFCVALLFLQALAVSIVFTCLKIGFEAIFGGALPKIRRHSPKDIAILRCAKNIFYVWDEENDQKKLEQKFVNSDVTHVVLIRRVCDDQVDGVNVEPLPLLHVEIAHNPFMNTSDGNADSSFLMQWLREDGIWTDDL